jgi:hypothetical protein
MCGGGGDFTGIPLVDDIIPNEIKDPINEVKRDIVDIIPDPIKQTIDDITPNELKTPEGKLFMKFVLPEIADLTGGDLLFTNTNIPFDGPTITDMPFDGPTLPTDIGIPNIPMDSFDGPTLPTDNPFDGPTLPTDAAGTTNSAGGLGTAADTVNGVTFGADGSIMDAAGNVIADAATSKPLLDAGMSIGDIYNYVKGGLNLANLTGILRKGGSLVGALMPSSEQLGSFFTNLGQAAPLAGAAGLGYLTYKDRANTNKSITDAYNNYLGKQSGIASAYGVGAGPQTLNYNVAGTPLAQAQPRTAAQTVVMPKAAKGGSINDLYGEYSELNNRMRNYRRLAKGGLI